MEKISAAAWQKFFSKIKILPKHDEIINKIMSNYGGKSKPLFNQKALPNFFNETGNFNETRKFGATNVGVGRSQIADPYATAKGIEVRKSSLVHSDWNDAMKYNDEIIRK